MSEADLAELLRVGREIRYRALGGKLSALGHELERIGRQWDRRLAAIKRLSEGESMR